MAFQDLIKYGVNTQGDRFAGLGEAAKQGFLEGEQRVKDIEDRAYLENERQRIADEREQEELDAVYGDLYVPPTGQVSYDAGIEMMGREWKAEWAAANAAKKAGQMSNEEFVQLKHDLRNRAQTLKAGQEYLGQFKSIFDKAKAEGQISKSTPAKIRLLGDALERGEVQIENINGRPTLIGQVADGEPVQIDMGALASGNANLRINQKVDTPGMVNQVAKGLEAYKTSLSTENGIALGNVSWEMIQDKAAQDIDQLINNESTVQAIAADELGYNSEQINALGKEELRNRVGDFLLDKVEKDYFPVEKVTNFTGLTDYQAGTLAINREKFNQGLNNQGQPNASLLRFGQEQADIQQTQQIYNNAIQTGDYRQLIGRGPILNAKPPGYFSSKWTIETKGGKIQIDPANPGDQQILANLLGLGSTQPAGGASETNPLGLNL